MKPTTKRPAMAAEIQILHTHILWLRVSAPLQFVEGYVSVNVDKNKLRQQFGNSVRQNMFIIIDIPSQQTHRLKFDNVF